MATIDVQIINGFVDGGQGGNPAGVVLEAGRFTREQKQRIAARVGLSETAFVSESQVADFKLEFFTPTRQIAHCGHATIATFSYLAQSGRIRGPHSSKETIDGIRAIEIVEGRAFMQQLAPRYIDPLDEGVTDGEILASLGLAPGDLLAGRRPVVVYTGNRFLIAPLVDEAAVLRCEPRHGQISAISERLGLIGYYVFSRETRIAGRDAGARMFAPFYGIPEESATGMAAGPLGCYLYDVLGLRKARMVIEQGRLMQPASPSELIVDLALENGAITGLMAGGFGAVSRVVAVETD